MRTKIKLFGKSVSRRQFLATTGGITFVVSASAILPTIPFGDMEEERSDEKQLNAWIHLNSDGKITVYNPAAEMGQGSMTALAVLMAEEMDADWSDINIEYSPIEPEIYGLRRFGRGGTMITVGSFTVRSYYEMLRKAGAQARMVLLTNVAGKWGVPVSELTTEPSLVVHKNSGKKLTYGEIAAFAKAPDKLPDIQVDDLKKPEQFRLIGKNIPRYDIPAKVDGSAQFAIDVQLQGMVYGVVSRAPVNGSRPNITNESAIRAIDGIIDIVVLEHGVGLVANSFNAALSAKRELKIEWSKGAKAGTHNSIKAFKDYDKIAANPFSNARELTSTGDVGQALASASKTYSSDYYNDYNYHAQMEPLNAVVSIAKDGKSADVWVGTQAPASAKSAAARTLGLDQSKVTLHPCYLGGGFGRRSMTDYVEEAAFLAKAVQKPLKLIWTREDDMQYGAFRPQCLQHMEAGVDDAGNVTGWKHFIVGPGGGLLGSGARIPFYSIPNQQIEVRSVDHGVRTKHWRAVGHGPNKFAIEAFIDEIASDRNIDPYKFRQKLMKNSPRALKVLDTAAKMANWGEPVKEGRARGISFSERSGSLFAGVCEISLNRKEGKIKVHHIWASLDAGVVVQPDNAKAQMEGAILFGMSSAFGECITFKNGEVEQSNFHNYPLLRITDAPETLDIELIPSNEAPSGIGEAGLPMIGGAIANAFASLTGKRLKHMPFTEEKVKEVLKG
ncbi:MAG: molybdopterin-dependent oxidoreductase [Bacteroidetes bacterium]|nr:molybdopterin-dependent oxidoreductase [Bacteroidota bacterium]